ncbi:hypothetical protein GCM10018787_02140 [Streptomyces thermodiastaticus]|nr:hypothetical protein GCM10018787_02140 [Streptomyces thermodiastaticus]
MTAGAVEPLRGREPQRHREHAVRTPLAVSDEQGMRVAGILAGGRTLRAVDRACSQVLRDKLGRLKGWHEHDHVECEGGAGSSSGPAAVGSRTA